MTLHDAFSPRGLESDLTPLAHHPDLVMIHRLDESHLECIRRHLLSLNDRDRYLRFGYSAQDEQIGRYVEALDFKRDEVLGIFDRNLELLAVAHLAFAKCHGYELCAEFGVSVVERARGRGYGAKLFERAARHARNVGVPMMFIHALSENVPMLKIARKAGARVERDGCESDAYLELPQATLDSRMAEMIEDRFAATDYTLKVQAKQFRVFLRKLQAMRRTAFQMVHSADA